jgi:PAS domain S-box-containing protein
MEVLKMASNNTKNLKLNASKKDMEDELNECEAKLEVLFNNVSSGVAIYETKNDGQDFLIVDFNPAAEEIEHVKKEDIIGKNVMDIFPGVKKFGILDVFRRIYKTGVPEHLPISIYRDERIAGWRENFVYRLPSGKVIAVYDDISVKKHSELAAKMTDQCFRAIADYTYDWEIWVGPNGRILWTNPAVQRLTGYSVKEIMSMKDYPGAIVFEQDRERINRAFRSAVNGSTGNDVEFRIVRNNGQIIWVAISWQPIYDDKGQSLGHRESIRDINERKETQLKLEEALGKAL